MLWAQTQLGYCRMHLGCRRKHQVHIVQHPEHARCNALSIELPAWKACCRGWMGRPKSGPSLIQHIISTKYIYTKMNLSEESGKLVENVRVPGRPALPVHKNFVLPFIPFFLRYFFLLMSDRLRCRRCVYSVFVELRRDVLQSIFALSVLRVVFSHTALSALDNIYSSHCTVLWNLL